jgi:hypothetical protein
MPSETTRTARIEARIAPDALASLNARPSCRVGASAISLLPPPRRRLSTRSRRLKLSGFQSRTSARLPRPFSIRRRHLRRCCVPLRPIVA